MPRLRLTVVYNQKRQSFDLDAPVLDIGRRPDAMLVLPLPFIAETHLILEDLLGGYRLRPASPDAPALHQGQPLPSDGIELPHDQGFELTLPAPGNATLTLLAEPLSTPVHPDATPAVAPAAPVTAPAVAPFQPFPPPPSAPPPRRSRSDVLLASSVLLGSLAVIAAIVLTRTATPPTPLDSSPPATADLPGRTPDALADHLRTAARAYTLGDLPAARQALTQASLAAPDDPVVLALELALRRELDRQESVPLQPVTPFREAPPPAPPSVPNPTPEPSPSTPTPDNLPPSQASTPPPAPPTPDPARDAELRRKLSQLREQIDAAGVNAPTAAKLTELGQAALAQAQTHVREQLAPSQLTFPDPADSRVILTFADGVFTVRGFAEQWNQNNQPVRVFYLTRLRPTSLTTFEHLGTEILR